jgi:acyl phosphate:glycerol-3-phosphate acyltransferase
VNPLFLTAVFSYLLGSIPFGYLLVRTIYGEDVRQTGSGNIGATNVSRTSPALGITTLVLDALKGAAAVLICRAIFPGRETLAATAALFAIVGHVFPIWLKFRGGKGVATAMGSFLVLTPKAVLVIIAAFVAVLVLFRYVSLGSIVAIILFPLLVWSLHGTPNTVILLATAASVLILAKHSKNIRRLLSGTEPRFGFRRG